MTIPAGDQFSYDHELSNGNLTIMGEIEQKQGWKRNLKVAFYLLIPENFNLDLHTYGGSINTDTITASLNGHTQVEALTSQWINTPHQMAQ